MRLFAVRLGLGLLTYFLVNITWVFFRAQSFGEAKLLLLSMFGVAGPGAQILPTLEIIKVVLVIAALLTLHWRFRTASLEAVGARVPTWGRALVWGGMVFLLIITQGGGNAFIYFQF